MVVGVPVLRHIRMSCLVFLNFFFNYKMAFSHIVTPIYKTGKFYKLFAVILKEKKRSHLMNRYILYFFGFRTEIFPPEIIPKFYIHFKRWV